jgi:site-specific recombinase XerD
MAQNLNVAHPTLEYTRTDYTALRAWVQRLPLERIAQLYYAPDAPQVEQGLEQFLTHMRHQLIERAIEANPRLAEGLAKARMGGAITMGVLDVLVKAAEAKPATPLPTDNCSRWFRPTTIRAIRALPGVETLQDLRAAIEQGGPTWWRPVPRLGKKRAQTLVAWLNRYPPTAVRQSAWLPAAPGGAGLVLTSQPLPLERIASVPSDLDGSQGVNRGQAFCLIQARNDLQAVQDYLHRYRQAPHTLRAYQRELERLLLWCVIVRRKPLSSILANDCEAYIDFLRSPLASFCGPRRSRLSPQWRPFEGPLSDSSQRQAVMIIRQAFGWLQDVRYLGANPWAVVSLPKPAKPLHQVQLEKALPAELWTKVQNELERQCDDVLPTGLEPSAWRLGTAALLLLGHTGLRISEAAAAQREHLSRSPDAPVWQLRVLGKGNKWRSVYFGARVMSALREHWRDLGDKPDTLLSPLMRPATPAGMRKEESGFHAVALARVVTRTLHSLAELEVFDEEEKARLTAVTAHKLRHTFGVVALEREMPLDVVQQLLGHASAATTAIYTRGTEKRLAEQVANVEK